MNISGVQEFLWAAAFFGHSLLLAVLVLRRRARAFPVFTALIAFYIARSILLYSLARQFGIRSWPYFLTFWTLGYVDDLIQLVVFYRLILHVFCPTGVWAKDTRRAFLLLVGASCVVALGLAVLASPSTVRFYQTYLLRSDFFTAALMSELFIGTMVLSATAGLPWKTHVARIAQGFGAYALVCVVAEAARNYFGLGHGQQTYDVLSDIEKFTYLGCLGYWIVALWREAPVPRELPETMLMQIYTLQRRVEDDLIRIRNWRRQ